MASEESCAVQCPKDETVCFPRETGWRFCFCFLEIFVERMKNRRGSKSDEREVMREVMREESERK